MKDYICKILGTNIKKYRKLRGLTQEKLAEAVELEIRTLSLVETGKSFVSSKTLSNLSAVLDVKPADLFEFTDANDTKRLYRDCCMALEIIKNNPSKLCALTHILNGML